MPLRQAPVGGLAYAVVRTSGDPLSLTAQIRRAVASVDPFLPVSSVRTMRQAIADNSSGLTNLAVLMAICGGIGGILSIVGIYSVMSYTVSQRMHEFGVRLALGASARDLLRLTLTEAGVLTGLGVTIGFVLAVVLGRALSSALFGLISLEPMTFLIVAAGLAVVSIGAACIPARRALRLDRRRFCVGSSRVERHAIRHSICASEHREEAALFTIVILTLALGIGANAAIFTVVNAVLLQPLPYPDPDRLMMVWTYNPRQGFDKDVGTYPNFEDWRRGSSSFERMSGYFGANLTLTGSGDPEQIRGARVTPEFFETMAVAPILGRGFTAANGQAGGERAVILAPGSGRAVSARIRQSSDGRSCSTGCRLKSPA